MAGWAAGPDPRVNRSQSVRRGRGQRPCRLLEPDSSWQQDPRYLRPAGSRHSSKSERAGAWGTPLRVRTLLAAGPLPRSDRQDAPRQGRRVGPGLRLGDRSVRSRPRPVGPHPNGDHRKHEHPNGHREDHRQRHESGAPLLAVSPNPMPQLPLPPLYHDRDRRPETNNARSARPGELKAPPVYTERARARELRCSAALTDSERCRSRGPAGDPVAVGLISPRGRTGSALVIARQDARTEDRFTTRR